MSHPARDSNNTPSEDDFAPRVRIVAVDDGTHLMKVGDTLELMIDPQAVSLHVFPSQEALDAYLQRQDRDKEMVIHLETVDDDLDEPTLEVDRNACIHLRATSDEPEILASDIFTALKRSLHTALSKLKNLREAASPTPPPARTRYSQSVSCADC